MRKLFGLLLIGVLLLSVFGAGCINTGTTSQSGTSSTPATTPSSTHTPGPQGGNGQGAGSGGPQGEQGQIPIAVNENGTVGIDELREYVESIPAGELTQEEKDGLLYMVEEEKLAHDVYTKLYEKWGLQIFKNIADSESTHINAVRLLLDKYGLTDPTKDEGIGEFQNPDIQKLYDQLIEMGMKSEIDALKVGALIEETDIKDLQERIDQTNKVDIITVYENLMAGSRNHLRAFVGQLESRGVTYTPQVLSEDEFYSILNSPMETGTTKAQPPASDTIPVVTDENGTVNTTELQEFINSTAGGQLTQKEIDGLLYMVEEEKLAHDVYVTLYEKWGLQIFNNIAQSESTHVNAVRSLLEKYNLTDPTANEPVGVFTNPDLQALYNQLIEQGSKSEIDALKVGALIEETDIIDLQERIDQTDKLDIIAVYENLMKGSRNHLRAFVKTLANYGVTYEPQLLSEDEYEAIVGTAMETGGGNGHGG
ncbi:DUF2202 domain-containing protein [Thermococcus sp. AM4]|uniref:DUF2202 domain-containing protein n=1 Tax=Thermococcus sp. (strain AM4) TaxID=246969 RepID=UPI0001870885|nr:conserved hypothetical protein, Phosphopantetheine adenylyltransferase-like protein [Thermococcus sp. AM4]